MTVTTAALLDAGPAPAAVDDEGRPAGAAAEVRHRAGGLHRLLPGAVLAAAPRAGHTTEPAVLVAANPAATLLRFLLFRAWVFPSRRR